MPGGFRKFSEEHRRKINVSVDTMKLMMYQIRGYLTVRRLKGNKHFLFKGRCWPLAPQT